MTSLQVTGWWRHDDVICRLRHDDVICRGRYSVQDPHNNRIAQWLGVKGDATGVFEGEMMTSLYPPLGTWKIVVTVDVSIIHMHYMAWVCKVQSRWLTQHLWNVVRRTEGQRSFLLFLLYWYVNQIISKQAVNVVLNASSHCLSVCPSASVCLSVSV